MQRCTPAQWETEEKGQRITEAKVREASLSAAHSYRVISLIKASLGRSFIHKHTSITNWALQQMTLFQYSHNFRQADSTYLPKRNSEKNSKFQKETLSRFSQAWETSLFETDPLRGGNQNIDLDILGNFVSFVKASQTTSAHHVHHKHITYFLSMLFHIGQTFASTLSCEALSHIKRNLHTLKREIYRRKIKESPRSAGGEESL